jgi:transglutaminase-like putative cysteine protease
VAGADRAVSNVTGPDCPVSGAADADHRVSGVTGADGPVSGVTGADPPAARTRGARLIIAALALVAAVPFRALLADDRYLLGAAAAVTLVTAVSFALSPRRALATSVGVATAALAAAAAAVLVAAGTPVGPDLLGALAHLPAGWQALLSSPAPAPVTPEIAALPVGGAAVAAFAGGELAARTRWAVAGALAPGALLVTALAYAGRSGAGWPVAAAAFAVGVLVLAALDRPGPPRPAGPVLAVAAGAACLAVATVVPMTAETRFDLHDRLTRTATVTATAVSPLSQAGAALAAGDDPAVFSVALDRPTGALRFRVATLDTYDGTSWRVGRTFLPVGDVLPRRYPAEGSPARITQDIVLTPAYAGPFLPALGAPTAVAAPGRDRLRYDNENGDLIAGDGTGDGDSTGAGDPAGPDPHYRLVSPDPAGGPVVPQAPTGDRLADLTALPAPVPDELDAIVRALPRGPDRQRVDALADRVRNGPSGYDPQGPPGHSYPRLVQYVTGGVRDGSVARGTVEQPPAAFAVLARRAGIPARVVVGYDAPRRPADGGPLVVTARQVTAWAEVHLEGEGWVAVDVVRPDRPSPSGPSPADTTSTTAVAAGREPAAATVSAPAPSPSPGPCGPSDPRCPAPPGWPGPPWPVLAGAAVLGLPVAVLAAKRLRRWRRRRRRTPAGRLAGARCETVECLSSRGVRVVPAMTLAELVAVVEPVLGPRALVPLARWARVQDTAVYAAAEPDHDLADEAWNAHDDVVAVLRATAGPGRRLRTTVDPRPLFLRHRVPAAPRPSMNGRVDGGHRRRAAAVPAGHP